MYELGLLSGFNFKTGTTCYKNMHIKNTTPVTVSVVLLLLTAWPQLLYICICH